MEELISIFQGILMFFEKHAVQIFPAIFAVFIVVLFVVLLSHRILKRKKAIVLESSAYYHKVESLNNRYSFQEDIFDDGCFDYTYVFDTKQKYDHYSVNEVMNALLQEKLQVFEQAIKDVDKNKDEYRKYCAEFENLHSEITAEECKAYKVRYDWYLKTEQALVEEITKNPFLKLKYIVGKNIQVLLAETTMSVEKLIMTVKFVKCLKIHGNMRHIASLRNADGNWSAAELQQKYVTK